MTQEINLILLIFGISILVTFLVLILRVFLIKKVTKPIVNNAILRMSEDKNKKKHIPKIHKEFNSYVLIFYFTFLTMILLELLFIVFLFIYPVAMILDYMQKYNQGEINWPDLVMFMFPWLIAIIPWILWTLRYYTRNLPFYLFLEIGWVRRTMNRVVLKELHKTENDINFLQEKSNDPSRINFDIEDERIELLQARVEYLSAILAANEKDKLKKQK